MQKSSIGVGLLIMALVVWVTAGRANGQTPPAVESSPEEPIDPSEEGSVPKDAPEPVEQNLEPVILPVVQMEVKSCPLTEPIQVAVHEMPPMVMTQGQTLTGFDIELWQMIAEEIGCDYTPVVLRSVPEVLTQVHEGTVHVGIAGITITQEREELVDFSFPYYDAGLAIMVKKEEVSQSMALFWRVTSWEVLQVFLGYLGYIFFCGFVLWLLERLFWDGERGEGVIARAFYPGIVQSIYFMNITATTVGYGHFTPRSWPAKGFVTAAMFGGFAFVGLVVGTIAGLTIEEVTLQQVRSVEDLVGRTVAVESGTTSEVAAQAAGANPVSVTDISQAFALLENGRIDAIVFDEPVLKHYEMTTGAGQVVVMDAFTTERYGILTTPDSDLTEVVNRTILGLMSDGRYDALVTQYFGD